MTTQPTRPEDVLEENQDYKVIKGVKVRKGTIAATIQNIALLDASDQEQRAELLEAIEQNAPALVVLDVHRYFQCRNAEVEAILERAAKNFTH